MSDSRTVWCLLGKKAGDNTQVLALARDVVSLPEAPGAKAAEAK